MLIALVSTVFLIVSILAVLLARSSLQRKQFQQAMAKTEGELANERQKNELLSSQLTNANHQLTQEVLSDPLTGLPNRQIFEDRLQQTLHQSKRFQMMFAVMFIDINDFKMVNDVFGYDVGDDLLKAVAKRLEISIRQLDTLCRYSGDHFVLVLPQLAKAETAIYIAKRLLEAVSQPIRASNQDLFVTASIGIALYPTDGDDEKNLLKNADTALSQAKLHGRSGYQFYHHGMHTLSRRELILNSSLRDPSVFQDFVLNYWPQIRVATNETIGIEAVLHWHHRDFGLVEGRELLRLIEKSGKLLEISEWLFRSALTQFQACQQQGSTLQRIFLPASLQQLESSHLVHKLSQIFSELNLEPNCLVLEISEDALAVKAEQRAKSLNMIKHMGISIAIAHFGTGQLSLQQLQKMPMDYLKIDESLTTGIAQNKESEAIVKMIASVAKGIGAVIIPEGVVSNEQKDTLVQLGCEVMQGPLLGALCTGADLLQQVAAPQKSTSGIK